MCRSRATVKQQRWHAFAEPDFLIARQRTRALFCPEIAAVAAATNARAHTRRQPLADPASLLRTGPAFEPPATAPEEDEQDVGDVDSCDLAVGAMEADAANGSAEDRVDRVMAVQEAENFASFAFDDVGNDEPPEFGNDDGAMVLRSWLL
jgi:hypothetical protein